MGASKFQFWPDQLLEAQIAGTIEKIEHETNVDLKIGLRDLLNRLLAEKERREKRSGRISGS